MSRLLKGPMTHIPQSEYDSLRAGPVHHHGSRTPDRQSLQRARQDPVAEHCVCFEVEQRRGDTDASDRFFIPCAAFILIFTQFMTVVSPRWMYFGAIVIFEIGSVVCVGRTCMSDILRWLMRLGSGDEHGHAHCWSRALRTRRGRHVEVGELRSGFEYSADRSQRCFLHPRRADPAAQAT